MKKDYTVWKIFAGYMIILLLLIASSCVTSKKAGGCGGSPTHLGN